MDIDPKYIEAIVEKLETNKNSFSLQGPWISIKKLMELWDEEGFKYILEPITIEDDEGTFETLQLRSDDGNYPENFVITIDGEEVFRSNYPEK